MDVSSLSPVMRDFVLQFKNADTYGSLITVTADDRIDEEIDEFSPVWSFNGEHLEHMMQLYKIRSQRYDVVCTIIWTNKYMSALGTQHHFIPLIA